MFRKFKDRLTEVSEEVKKDPRFANSLASVNQLAQQTYSALNKNEKTGEEPYDQSSLEASGLVPSYAELQQRPETGLDPLDISGGGHKRSLSNDLQSFFDGGRSVVNNSSVAGTSLPVSASSPSLGSSMNTAAGNNFFSLTEEDDLIGGSANNSPSKSGANNNDASGFTSVELAGGGGGEGRNPNFLTSSPTHRNRRLSSGSQNTEAANLFPIYEAPQHTYRLPSTDLDSTAGSEWDEDGTSGQHLSSVTKEQLFQMLQKTRTRYHKYKGRYTDIAKAYNDLENENGKVKNVMQQTQDKALRRISELKEQCSLEQKAKRHLEEELRSDLEEKQHIIEALQTKVTLLKSGGKNVIDDAEGGEATENSLDQPSGENGGDVIKRDADKVSNLEEKIRRLEGLLTKCKESIKANKQKTTALTDVKESLAKQVSERETECEDLRSQLLSTQATLTAAQKEIEGLKQRGQNDELLIAETKMVMHQEIITKDEEIGKLRTNLKQTNTQVEEHVSEITKLKDEIDELKLQQLNLEKSLESEKAAALQEMSRGKAGAIQTLHADMEKKIADLVSLHDQEKEQMGVKFNQDLEDKLQAADREKKRELSLKDDELKKAVQEKEEEGRLALEELELRLSALSVGDDSKAKLVGDLEAKIKASAAEKAEIIAEIGRVKEELQSVRDQVKQEFKEEVDLQSKKAAEAVSSLEDANKKLTEAGDLRLKEQQAHEGAIREFEQKVQSLEEQRDKLLADATAGNDASANLTKEIENLKLEVSEKSSKIEALENNLQGKIQSVRESEVALQKLRGELDEQKSSNQSLTKDLAKAAEAQKVMAENHQASLQSLKDQVESAAQSDMSSQLESRLAIVKEEYEQKLNQRDQEAEALQKKLSVTVAEIEDKKQTLASLGDELAEAKKFQQEASTLREKVASLKASLSDSTGKHEQELGAMKGNLDSLTSDYKSLEAEHSQTTKLFSDLEKEVLDLRHREQSLKGNEQKMIAYQKDLQDQLNVAEKRETSLRAEFESQQQTIQDQKDELAKLEVKKNEEIEKLKSDVEMKIRLERERENSFKEHQVQSIEYQKKLQDQLTSMETKLQEAKEKAASSTAAHNVEVEKMSRQIEDISQKLVIETSAKEECESKISVLQSDLDAKSHELESMQEKVEEAKQTSGLEATSLGSKIEELQSEVRRLTELNNSMQNQIDEASRKDHLLAEAKTANEEEMSSMADRHVAEVKEFEQKLQEALETIENSNIKWEEKETKWQRHCEELKGQKTAIGSELDELKEKLELTNQMLFNAQNKASEKDSEIEELKVQLHHQSEEVDGLRKDLRSSQSDKNAQLVEFEETMEDLEKQVAELKSKNEHLQDQVDSQSRKIEDNAELGALQTQMEESHEQNIKSLVRKYETQLAEKEEAHDVEVHRIRDDAEAELKRRINEYNVQIADMKQDLYEKTAMYDELLEKHEVALRAKQDELDEEVESCNRIYQAKISELQEAHRTEIDEMIQKEAKVEQNSWNWERATSIDEDAVEDMQRTPTKEQRDQQLRQTQQALAASSASSSPPPATLTVTVNHHENTAVCNHSHTLEEAAEFEYLKNVLFQYMMGKESTTLARVLGTVVKFTPQELQEVIKHEERKQSVLSSLGISNILPHH